LFCISGKGKITTGNIEVELKANSVINFIANSKIVINNEEYTIDAILIKYGSNVKEILSAHSLRVFCPVTGATKITIEKTLFSELLFYIKKIERELETNDGKPDEIVMLNLIMLVKELSRAVNLENTISKIPNKTILNFINCINATLNAWNR